MWIPAASSYVISLSQYSRSMIVSTAGSLRSVPTLIPLDMSDLLHYLTIGRFHALILCRRRAFKKSSDSALPYKWVCRWSSSMPSAYSRRAFSWAICSFLLTFWESVRIIPVIRIWTPLFSLNRLAVDPLWRYWCWIHGISDIWRFFFADYCDGCNDFDGSKPTPWWSDCFC